MDLKKADDEDSDNTSHLPAAVIPKSLAIHPGRLPSHGSSTTSYSSSTSSSSPSSSSASSSSATKPNAPVIKLQFINTVHPSESTTAKRISQIRSHVAKDSHARRRQRKASKACSSSSLVLSPAAASAAARAEQAARLDTPDSTSSGGPVIALRQSQAARASSSGTAGKEGGNVRGFRRIAPKNGAVVPWPDAAGPRQLIGDAKRDGWNGCFAWDLSDDEYSIFNFYLEWVLQFGYEICFPREEVPGVMRRMKSTYVPFAVQYPALLACIFYVAYHRRSLNTGDPYEAARCSFKMERYRLACIEMMKEAVAEEATPTDQTISLAMILSSEAYFEGNTDISFTHAHAARTMVAERGGLDNLGDVGINGLLSFLLATSVYSGNYWFVPGCSRAPED